MKRLVIGLVCLAVFLCAYTPEKPFTFSAGELIRADRLNENEDTFYSALTDGDADLSVGTVSANTLKAVSYTYTTSPKTVYLYTNFAEFVPSTSTSNLYIIDISSSIPVRGKFGTTSPNAAVAQVYLPNGAVVTSFLVSANTEISVTLSRMTASTGAFSDMASAAGGSTDSSISNATVDSSTYSYMLIAASSTATKYLYWTKITYTLTSPAEILQ